VARPQPDQPAHVVGVARLGPAYPQIATQLREQVTTCRLARRQVEHLVGQACAQRYVGGGDLTEPDTRAARRDLPSSVRVPPLVREVQHRAIRLGNGQAVHVRHDHRQRREPVEGIGGDGDQRV
jgi:hypothetical protein